MQIETFPYQTTINPSVEPRELANSEDETTYNSVVKARFLGTACCHGPCLRDWPRELLDPDDV